MDRIAFVRALCPTRGLLSEQSIMGEWGVLLSQPLRFPTLAPTQTLSSVWSSEARKGPRYVRSDKMKALADHGPSCSTSGHVRQFDLVLHDRAQ